MEGQQTIRWTHLLDLTLLITISLMKMETHYHLTPMVTPYSECIH
jgi:hypothetical protein